MRTVLFFLFQNDYTFKHMKCVLDRSIYQSKILSRISEVKTENRFAIFFLVELSIFKPYGMGGLLLQYITHKFSGVKTENIFVFCCFRIIKLLTIWNVLIVDKWDFFLNDQTLNNMKCFASDNHSIHQTTILNEISRVKIEKRCATFMI